VEIDAISTTTTIAKMAANCLEYQKQRMYLGYGLLGHVQAKCPTNPLKPFFLVVIEEDATGGSESGKG